MCVSQCCSVNRAVDSATVSACSSAYIEPCLLLTSGEWREGGVGVGGGSDCRTPCWWVCPAEVIFLDSLCNHAGKHRWSQNGWVCVEVVMEHSWISLLLGVLVWNGSGRSGRSVTYISCIRGKSVFMPFGFACKMQLDYVNFCFSVLDSALNGDLTAITK